MTNPPSGANPTRSDTLAPIHVNPSITPPRPLFKGYCPRIHSLAFTHPLILLIPSSTLPTFPIHHTSLLLDMPPDLVDFLGSSPYDAIKYYLLKSGRDTVSPSSPILQDPAIRVYTATLVRVTLCFKYWDADWTQLVPVSHCISLVTSPSLPTSRPRPTSHHCRASLPSLAPPSSFIPIATLPRATLSTCATHLPPHIACRHPH
jgi:hypothetical protein